MHIGLLVPTLAFMAGLAGCANVPQNAAGANGTVADVYVETAPGLFVERNLARHQPGAKVAVVDLAEEATGEIPNVTAWVSDATGIARGDAVRVRLSQDLGHANGRVIPVRARVVDVVASDDAVVAAVAMRSR